MKKIYLIILLLPVIVRAQEQITCADGVCTYAPALNISSSTNFVNYTNFEISGLSDDVSIEVPNQSLPRDFRGYLKTTDPRGIDLDLSLNSSVPGLDASSFVVIADALDELNVSANGFSGSIGRSASETCAQRILDGDYGASVRSAFTTRRNNDAGIPANQCDSVDLLSIQELDHTCEADYTYFPNNQISATRWTGLRKCDGEAARKLCLKKKMKIECEWTSDAYAGCCDSSLSPVGSNWSCDVSKCVSGNSGWHKNFTFIEYEKEITRLRSLGYNDSAICVSYSNRKIQGNSEKEQVNWYGGFSGSYHTRDLNIYPVISSDRKYVKMEFAAGGQENDCDSSSCVNSSDMNNYSPFFSDNAGYVKIMYSNYGINCYTTGNYVHCDIGDVTGPTHELGVLTDFRGHRFYKYTGFSYKVRMWFYDKYGVLRHETITRRLGHR